MMNPKRGTKEEIAAADTKFSKETLRPDDRNYIDNLDKVYNDKCGPECKKSLDSYESKLSAQKKAQEKNPNTLPGDRAGRGETNSAEDTYQHRLNHLRLARGVSGEDAANELASWHSVESARKKDAEAQALRDAQKNGKNGQGKQAR
ncbi:uncharacterized protein ColSpa_01505 [Colletotrichum spaethianum]|uniref:Uncharacterized protein n=1 Tax=Colletotrichum spaethianum TaxID=700344 RepID=A0AA37L7B6_9PEZI|nr:uncharacterized protein ColSpa_01505 [Colletotrichum spaethianum]GKT41324.1 hypothetical protein ColSpa_01505 [Colletotrichum spaethianum]